MDEHGASLRHGLVSQGNGSVESAVQPGIENMVLHEPITELPGLASARDRRVVPRYIPQLVRHEGDGSGNETISLRDTTTSARDDNAATQFYQVADLSNLRGRRSHHQRYLSLSSEETLVDFLAANVVPKLFPPIFAKLVSRHNTSSGSVTGESGSGSGPSWQGQSEKHVSLSENLRRGHKRTRTSEDNDSDGNDSSNSPIDIDAPAGENLPGKLACHFHKYDPQKFKNHLHNGRRYKTCTNGFDSIKNLKEHHNRVHRQDFVCPSCCTPFKKETELSSHLKERPACEVRSDPDFSVEFITTEERRKVFSKKSPKNSTKDHWFLMWTILFPNHNPPTSPYICSESDDWEATFLRPQWAQTVELVIQEAAEMASNQVGGLPADRAELMALMRNAFDTLENRLLHGQERSSLGSRDSCELSISDPESTLQQPDLDANGVNDTMTVASSVKPVPTMLLSQFGEAPEMRSSLFVSHTQVHLGDKHAEQTISSPSRSRATQDAHLKDDPPSWFDDVIDWDADLCDANHFTYGKYISTI